MEHRRQEPRFELDQPVTVKNLQQPEALILGRLVNFSAQGTRVILEQELHPGTLVRVEWGGTILLGEVVYCQPQGSEFAAGIELEDALYDSEGFLAMVRTKSATAAGRS
jgi:hypothetical protein